MEITFCSERQTLLLPFIECDRDGDHGIWLCILLTTWSQISFPVFGNAINLARPPMPRLLNGNRGRCIFFLINNIMSHVWCRDAGGREGGREGEALSPTCKVRQLDVTPTLSAESRAEWPWCRVRTPLVNFCDVGLRGRAFEQECWFRDSLAVICIFILAERRSLKLVKLNFLRRPVVTFSSFTAADLIMNNEWSSGPRVFNFNQQVRTDH